MVLLPLPPGPHEGGHQRQEMGGGITGDQNKDVEIQTWRQMFNQQHIAFLKKMPNKHQKLAMESHIGAPFCDGERCMKPTTKMGRNDSRDPPFNRDRDIQLEVFYAQTDGNCIPDPRAPLPTCLRPNLWTQREPNRLGFAMRRPLLPNKTGLLGGRGVFS